MTVPPPGADSAGVLTLGSDRFRLRVAPPIGASVIELSLRHGGVWAPLLRSSPEPLRRASDASSFLLAPWSNRVRAGRFAFQGREYPLDHPEKHAIHGEVRDRPWRVVDVSPGTAILAFDSRDFADVVFPFPFVAEVSFRVDGAAVTQTLRITSTGPAPMPAGLGFHPYFQRVLVDARDRVELELPVRGVYPGDTPLPTGPPVPLRPEQDFSRLRPLDVELDHCFAGWSGHARLRWPASGIAATLESSPALRHVVVYSPAGKPFFCIEPVSHANDGFNLLAAGQRDTGIVVLEPGRTLEGGFTLRLEDAG